MAISDEINLKLTTAFTPTSLDVLNESHLHAGHSGDDGSGESHFRVVIKAAAFTDMTRLARHRAVHAALGAELIGKIHALALEIDGA
ncbi:MAG: BolA family transcriptional regulator [Paracoccaceae bacterium]|nr:BolA family transcriptional regulator [Paracoccaceae bacterium]